MFGIANSGIEIDDRIERPLLENPLIDRFPDGFALLAVIIRPGIRGHGAAHHADSVQVRLFHELPDRCDEIFRHDGVGGVGSRTCAASDIVDAFEQNYPRHARLAQHILVEASQRVHAGNVAQNPVPADALIHHRDRRRCRIAQQTLRQAGRPGVVGIGRRTRSVGNRVSERDDRRGIRGGQHVNSRKPIPGLRCDRVLELRLTGKIALF